MPVLRCKPIVRFSFIQPLVLYRDVFASQSEQREDRHNRRAAADRGALASRLANGCSATGGHAWRLSQSCSGEICVRHAHH